jgi:hypothetical protein
VKYDRPVWQIMHECADAMPPVFRYDDVRTWFADHYPEVNEATIRAHLIGLTEGGRAKHVQFAPRSPVFRRVARGEYEPIALSERGEDPHAAPSLPQQIKMSGNGHHLPPSPPAPPESASDDQAVDEGAKGVDEEEVEEELTTDIILLGSVGDRVNVPAPAKEVFRDLAFQRGRLDAEVSGSEWFILSAEHGLIAPNEWISPDSRTLADMDPHYRVVWASWVVARLESLVGSVDGMVVRIDAPSAFTGPLFTDLQDAGAIVSSGPIVRATVEDEDADVFDDGPFRRTGRTRVIEAPTDERLLIQEVAAEPEVEQVEVAVVKEVETVSEELAPVIKIDAGTSVAAHLANPRNAVPASDAASLPMTPGVYGWLVDQSGARELNRCLKLPVSAGLVFVGQVGGSSWHTLVDPIVNLRDHVDRVQLHGRTRASTFRMTLATVLSEHLGMTSLEDRRLTDWMLTHLSISTWAVEDGDGLRELAQLLVGQLDPPLNVDHLPANEYRDRLQQMRGELA